MRDAVVDRVPAAVAAVFERFPDLGVEFVVREETAVGPRAASGTSRSTRSARERSPGSA
jgi:hypothetical protein